MKTPPRFRLATLAAVMLALAANAARADVGRPNPLRRPVESTAQAHLEAAQRALHNTREDIQRVLPTSSGAPTLTRDGGRRTGARNPAAGGETQVNDATTLAFGGYLPRAAENLVPALAAIEDALAYVRAHPETNVLAAGPAPADEPKPPARLTGSLPGDTVASLNFALTVLTNNPARDYRGPVLGDLGGHRAKILAAIARVGADLAQAIAYQQGLRGGSGSSGVIPLASSAALMPDPKDGPTARTYLRETSRVLDSLGLELARSGRNYHGDKTQGGHVDAAEQSLRAATASVKAALAWLDTHPEADALLAGPARPEPSAARPVALPSPMRGFGGGTARTDTRPKLTPRTASELNRALGLLQNNSDPAYRGPVLGDLGGHRGKIMDDLGRALEHTLAGIAAVAPADPDEVLLQSLAPYGAGMVLLLTGGVGYLLVRRRATAAAGAPGLPASAGAAPAARKIRLLPLAAAGLLSAAAVALTFKFSVAALESNLPEPARPRLPSDNPAPPSIVPPSAVSSPNPGPLPTSAKWPAVFRVATGIEPANAPALVYEGLEFLAALGNIGHPNPKALQARPALGIYQLVVTDGILPIADNPRDLPVAGPPQALYYSVELSGRPVSGLNLALPDGGLPRVIKQAGDYVQGMARIIPQALDDLAAMEAVKAGSYEPRILNFGPSSSRQPAIWLKAAPGGADLIYPLGAITPGLKPRTIYTVDEFLDAVGLELKRRGSGAAGPGGAG